MIKVIGIPYTFEINCCQSAPIESLEQIESIQLIGWIEAIVIDGLIEVDWS